MPKSPKTQQFKMVNLELGVERAHFLKIYANYRERENENAKVLPVLERLGLASPELFALPAGNGGQK